MGMRLLPKQEISVLQASKKKAEIDEGIKLARRVDSLREIAVSEEISLEEFRKNTLKSISEDIKKIEAERNAVLSEVNQLREELANGTKVLDDRENVLNGQIQLLESKEKAFTERLDIIKVVVDELKSLSTTSNAWYQQINTTIRLIDSVRAETSSAYEQAKEVVTEALHIYSTTAMLADTLRNEFYTRDIAVASKERDIIIRVGHLNSRAEALRVKELELIDREQTLEREFNRLRK